MTVVIPVTKGTLSDLGYSVYLPDADRQRIIREACKKESPLRIYRHLIARATQHKNINPEVARILRKDAEWLKSVAYKGRSTWVLDPDTIKVREGLTDKPAVKTYFDVGAKYGLIRVLKLETGKDYPEFALYFTKKRLEKIKKALQDAGLKEEGKGKYVLRTDKFNIFVYG